MTARSTAEQPDWRVTVMNLLWSMLVTAICIVLFFWLAMKLYQYVLSQWQPGTAIAVGTFTTAGLDADVGDNAGKALSSRLERLRRYSRSDTSGFGLVKTPALISVPNQVKERKTQARQRLEQLTLKVSDVSINELVKALSRSIGMDRNGREEADRRYSDHDRQSRSGAPPGRPDEPTAGPDWEGRGQVDEGARSANCQ
jgi:hypothetical protein